MKPCRVALFGGSFNPIHRGHIALAEAAVEQGLADEVWLMVSPHNPLKAAEGLIDEQLRIQWARAAVADCPHIEASDFEFHLPRPSYTWHTLTALRRAYPDKQFLLLIGADNWLSFPRWAHAADILASHELIVYPREGYPLPEQLPRGLTLLRAPLLPISSTDIREAVRQGKSIAGWVPEGLEEEIARAYAPR